MKSRFCVMTEIHLRLPGLVSIILSHTQRTGTWISNCKGWLMIHNSLLSSDAKFSSVLSIECVCFLLQNHDYVSLLFDIISNSARLQYLQYYCIEILQSCSKLSIFRGCWCCRYGDEYNACTIRLLFLYNM